MERSGALGQICSSSGIVDDVFTGQPFELGARCPGELASFVGDSFGVGSAASGVAAGFRPLRGALLPTGLLFAGGAKRALLCQSELLFEPLVLGFKLEDCECELPLVCAGLSRF